MKPDTEFLIILKTLLHLIIPLYRQPDLRQMDNFFGKRAL